MIVDFKSKELSLGVMTIKQWLDISKSSIYYLQLYTKLYLHNRFK